MIACPAIHEFGLCNASCTHGQPRRDEVVTCRAWLRRWAYPRKSINRRRSSYGLKHDVEGSCSSRTYVSNGSFIKAAELEGYRVVPCAAGSPNAFFNMGIRHEPLPFDVAGGR